MNVLIVGTGQIGGSVGFDLTLNKSVKKVIGFDADKRQVRLALKKGAIHDIAPDLRQGIEQADIIILAIPIKQIIRLIPFLEKHVSRRNAVLDVASTKSEIERAIKSCGCTMNYISGHPLAGNVGQGMAAARPGLFNRAYFTLTPLMSTDKTLISRVAGLVRSLGARPLLISPDEHDALIALTIGLPHLLALALINMAVGTAKRDDKIWKLVGGSFRGATRVARSSPDLIIDLVTTNKDHVVNSLDSLIKILHKQKDVLSQNKITELKEFIRIARKASSRVKYE